MAVNFNMPPQVEGHVNQNPLCIMFINEDGEDKYYVNMNGDLTVAEQKFFQYIGKRENEPDHRNEWRRSVDVTNYFIQLIADINVEDDWDDILHYLHEYDAGFTVQLVNNVYNEANRLRWRTGLDKEDLNNITGDGQYPLRIIVVNENY
jgi:hypothetical protein